MAVLLLLAGERLLLLPGLLLFQPPLPLAGFLGHALDHRLDGVGHRVGAAVEEAAGLSAAAAAAAATDLRAEEPAYLEPVGRDGRRGGELPGPARPAFDKVISGPRLSLKLLGFEDFVHVVQILLGGQELVVIAHPAGLALHGLHHAPLEVGRGAAAGQVAGEKRKAVVAAAAAGGIPGDQELARLLPAGAVAGAVRGQGGGAGQDALEGLVQGCLALVVSHALQEVICGILQGGAESGTARRDPGHWRKTGGSVRGGFVRG